MGEYLFDLMRLFVGTFVSATAKTLAKRLFGKKGKEKSTLASKKRKEGGNSN